MTRVRRGRRASNHWQQFVTQVSSSGNVLYICNICRNTFNSKHVYSHVRQAHRREFQAASGTLHAAADDKSSSEDDTRSSHEENPCSMDVDEGQPRQQTAETPDSTAAAGAAGADAVVSDSEGLFDQEDEVPEGADDSQQHDSELDDEFTEQAAEQDQDYTAFWDRYYDGDWCSSDEGSDSAHDTGSDDSEAGTSSGSAGEAGTQSDGDDEETDSSEHGGCSSSDNSRDRSGTDGSSRSGSQTESSARSGTSSATSSGSDPSSGVSDSGSASSAGSDSDDSPAPNTIPWYQQRLEMPVWPGGLQIGTFKESVHACSECCNHVIVLYGSNHCMCNASMTIHIAVPDLLLVDVMIIVQVPASPCDKCCMMTFATNVLSTCQTRHLMPTVDSRQQEDTYQQAIYIHLQDILLVVLLGLAVGRTIKFMSVLIQSVSALHTSMFPQSSMLTMQQRSVHIAVSLDSRGSNMAASGCCSPGGGTYTLTWQRCVCCTACMVMDAAVHPSPNTIRMI